MKFTIWIEINTKNRRWILWEQQIFPLRTCNYVAWFELLHLKIYSRVFPYKKIICDHLFHSSFTRCIPFVHFNISKVNRQTCLMRRRADTHNRFFFPITSTNKVIFQGLYLLSRSSSTRWIAIPALRGLELTLTIDFSSENLQLNCSSWTTTSLNIINIISLYENS